MKKYRSKKAGANILRTYDELLQMWEIPFEEKMIETRYGATHIVVCGKADGAPLILFHGVGDNSALMWVYNAKALGQHFRLYAVDTIGGPGKSVMGEKYDADFDDVIWIDDIMNGLKLEKASFMGVSHGGYLIQLYSLCRPEKTDKAICIASSIPVGKSGNHMKTMIKIFLPEALFPTKNNVIRLLKKLSGKHYDVFTNNPTIMEHYTWLLKGFNNMAMSYHKVRSFSDKEIEDVKNRLYVLVGLDDPFQKLGGTEALKSYGINAKFYEGVGHGINHEISDEINQIVIKIIKGEGYTLSS